MILALLVQNDPFEALNILKDRNDDCRGKIYRSADRLAAFWPSACWYVILSC